MLKRGWMNRYLPPIARRPCRTSASLFGYVWAGLMFGSAALNIALALTLDADDLGGVDVGLGHRQQGRPVPDPVRRDDAPSARGAVAPLLAAIGLRVYLNWTPTTS